MNIIKVWAMMTWLATGLPSFAANQPQMQAFIPYQSQIEAGPNENFDYAAVQIWMLIVPGKFATFFASSLHPLGSGASTLAHAQPWIELVRTENAPSFLSRLPNPMT